MQGVAVIDSLNEVQGTTSSMDTVRIQPRTPRQGTHDTQEIELTLLEEDEQRQAAVGVSDHESARTRQSTRPMSGKDKRSMGILIILCEFTCHYRVNVTNVC